MIKVEIDTRNIIGHIYTLSKLHKSALPVAVQQTLNGAAFDVKTKTMPTEADRFEKRKPTFFKANSKVVPARGFNIDKMESTVGFIPKPGDKSHSVEDLEAQEEHKQIDNRAFIALGTARQGNSFNRQIRTNNRMDKLPKIHDPLQQKARLGKPKDSEGMSFILTAMLAGKGGLIFGTGRQKGARTVYRINKIARLKKITKSTRQKGIKTKKWNTFVGLTPMFNVKANRKVTPDSKYKGFMRQASMDSQKKMEQMFEIAANKQIAKFTRP